MCQLLQRHGIQYFYADKDIVFNGNRLSKFRPGLYKVDTSSGFTLVDSGGSASLWGIDISGCRPADALTAPASGTLSSQSSQLMGTTGSAPQVPSRNSCVHRPVEVAPLAMRRICSV